MVRIDSGKYPDFGHDREHPFLALSAQARTQEIDSFLARLRGRTRKWGDPGPGRLRSAA